MKRIAVIGRKCQCKSTMIEKVFGVQLRNERPIGKHDHATVSVQEYACDGCIVIDTPQLDLLKCDQFVATYRPDAFIICVTADVVGDSLDRDFIEKYCIRANKPFLVCFTRTDSIDSAGFVNLPDYLRGCVCRLIGDKYPSHPRIILAGVNAWLTAFDPSPDRRNRVEGNPHIRTAQDVLQWIRGV